MHEACHSGAIDMGKLLIAAGANVTLMNKKGSTPLHTLSYCSSSGLPFADFTDLLVNAVASSTGLIHTVLIIVILHEYNQSLN